MAVKIVNYLQSRITDVGGIAAGDTEVSITAGDGAKILADIPDIGSPDWTYAWFKDDAGNREPVKITGIATDLLTIVRGIDSRYPARAWAQNDVVHFSLCLNIFEDLYGDAIATAAAALSAHAADTHHIAVGTVMIFGQNSAPVGWTRKSNWTDNAMLCYAASGNIASGGSANPQSSHLHTGPLHSHVGAAHQHTISHVHATASTTLTSAQSGRPAFDINVLATSVTNEMEGGGVSGGYIRTAGNGGGGAYVYSTPAVNASAGHDHGNTGAASVSLSGSGGSTNTGDSAAANTGANAAPIYQEVIAATKDAY